MKYQPNLIAFSAVSVLFACTLLGCKSTTAPEPAPPSLFATWDLVEIVETEVVPAGMGGTPEVRTHTEEDFWFRFNEDGTGQKNTSRYGLETFTYTVLEISGNHYLTAEFDGINWTEQYSYVLTSSRLTFARSMNDGRTWRQALTFEKR